MNYIKILSCVAFVAGVMASCSDNVPVSVSRICMHQAGDTETVLTEIRLGESIRIEGSGFASTKAVYCNGVEVSGINPNLITDTNIIFTVPRSIPIGSEVENPDDLNTIRIVTDSESFVYRIYILCDPPSITGVSNTLAKAGEVFYIYGENLRGLSTITFPGDVVVNADGFMQSEDYTTVTMTVPEGGDVTPGAICVEGVSGGAYTYNYMNCSAGIFLSSFDGEGQDTFVRKHTGDSGHGIAATEIGTVPVPSVTGGEPGSPEVYCVMPGSPCDLDPNVLDNQNAGWVRFDIVKAFNEIAGNSATGISRDTPCNQLAFQFDYYMTAPWSCGAFRIELTANDSDTRQTTISWVDDGVVTPVSFNGWQTLTMPCSQNPAMKDRKLGDVIDGLSGASDYALLMFRLGRFQMDGAGSYYWGETMTNAQIYVGNVRLVPYVKESFE